MTGRRWLRRSLRSVGAVVALLVTVVLVVFGYAQLKSRQPVTLPAPTGPELVGRVIYDWVDGSRPDPYAADRHTRRELSVWVWYPAEPAPGARLAPYVPADWERAFAYPGDFGQTAPGAVRPHSYDGAPVAGGRFPVLVLTPGLGMNAASYTAIAEELASQGYVVAGINPTYSTNVVLSGGRLVRAVPAAADAADLDQLDGVWSTDMRFVANQVQTLGAVAGGRFGGRIDARRVGFLGHSAGGAAAASACRLDARCGGAVDLDGDLVGDVVRTGLSRPFLFVGHEGSLSESSQTLPALRGVLRGEAAGQGHVLTVAGTRHDSFTDRSALFNLFGRQLGVLGSLNGARALCITGAYLHAFFDAALLGEDGSMLTAPTRAYPEVRIESV